MERVDRGMNFALSKKAMKSKFVDACASAKVLRKTKVDLMNQLVVRFKYSKNKCRRLVKEMLGKQASQRHILRKKTVKKYQHCERKMKRDRDRNDFRDIPDCAWEVVKGVNLFQDTLMAPEDRADPMVCSPSIDLSGPEVAFLKRGPRFMLRQEIDANDFKVEMEKMTVKAKMSATNVHGRL